MTTPAKRTLYSNLVTAQAMNSALALDNQSQMCQLLTFHGGLPPDLLAAWAWQELRAISDKYRELDRNLDVYAGRDAARKQLMRGVRAEAHLLAVNTRNRLQQVVATAPRFAALSDLLLSPQDEAAQATASVTASLTHFPWPEYTSAMLTGEASSPLEAQARRLVATSCKEEARWLRESAKALASLLRSEDLERLDTHLKNRLDLVRKTGRAAATWSIGLDLKEPA